MRYDIHLEAEYPYPPERVWTALTTPEAIGDWLMETDFKPVVGHRFQLRDPDARGWRGYVDGEVLEVDPPRKLAYTWVGDERIPQTVVTFTLTPSGEGTRLTLDHTGFEGLRAYIVGRFLLGRGWRKHMLQRRFPDVLARLDEYVGSEASEGGGSLDRAD